MRRAPAAFLSLLCSLPIAGSALVILAVPPISGLLPAALRSLARDAAALPFRAIAALPPDSLLGQLFYGSYDLLVPLFGASALAVHSALLALPFLAAAIWLARRPGSRRPNGDAAIA